MVQMSDIDDYADYVYVPWVGRIPVRAKVLMGEGAFREAWGYDKPIPPGKAVYVDDIDRVIAPPSNATDFIVRPPDLTPLILLELRELKALVVLGPGRPDIDERLETVRENFSKQMADMGVEVPE